MIPTNNTNNPDCGGLSGQMIPAGLADNYSEIFADGKALKGIYKGTVKSFNELPSLIKAYFSTLYSQAEKENPSCTTTLLRVFKPQTYAEELKQFVKCNYGGLDNNADFFPERNPKKEYWNCGRRGKCPAEGIVCRPDCICKYDLTIRETEIIKHIADGKVACEVSAKLEISENTVRTHEAHIKSKLGIHTRGEIIKFAYKNNIIL